MPRTDQFAARLSGAAWIVLTVLLGAALSRWLSPGQSLSLLWAPAGLIVAIAWKYGRWTLLPSALAMAAWGAFSYPQMRWMGAVAATVEVLCALLTGITLSWALKRLSATRADLVSGSMPQLHWLLRFYAASLVVGAPVAALIGSLAFSVAAIHPSLAFVEVLVAYWVIQALGLLLFAPTALALFGAGPNDANPIPFPPPTQRKRTSRQRLDILSVALVLLLTAAILGLRASGQETLVPALSLAYLPAMALCAMRRDALATYVTLTVSALVLCTALSFDPDAALFGGRTQAKVPISVFETIVLVFFTTLLAQLLQAVSSDRAEAMRRLQEQSSHDALTGLGNELGLSNWLGNRDASQHWLIVGVFFGSNPRLDTALGSIRLITMRQLIAKHLGMFDADFIARTDATRYVLAFADTPTARASIQQLRSAFNHFSVSDENGEDLALHGTTRVLRLQPQDHPNAMLVVATLATLMAKRWAAEGNALAVHELTPELQSRLQAQTQRNEQVRGWILNNQIVLFAQSIQSSRSSDTQGVSFEVLCRLRDDNAQLVQPGDFFEVAHQAGLSALLDRKIIAAVFDWFQQHPDALAVTRKCAINLSPASLTDQRLLPFVRGLIDEHQLPPSRFCFEITEASAMDDVELSRSNVQGLRELGFRVSIDDFGTGFATYSYLKRYQVDEIKIDGSFVTALGDNKIDNEIVQSIVRVAQMLNVKTVAEFVATDELRDCVQRLGVDYVQGYAIGKPLPIADVFAAA